MPDQVATLGRHHRVLFYPDDQTSPQLLSPVSEAEIAALPEDVPVLPSVPVEGGAVEEGLSQPVGTAEGGPLADPRGPPLLRRRPLYLLLF